MLSRLKRFFSIARPSYFRGGTERPLSEESVSQVLARTARDLPDQLAVISDFQELQLSFSELFNISRRAAANLVDLGLKPGTKVGIYSPNNLEWLICQYACALADLHMVNINPAYKPRELVHGLSLTEVDTLVVADNERPARILDNVDTIMESEGVQLWSNNELGKVKITARTDRMRSSRPPISENHPTASHSGQTGSGYRQNGLCS